MSDPDDTTTVLPAAGPPASADTEVWLDEPAARAAPKRGAGGRAPLPDSAASRTTEPGDEFPSRVPAPPPRQAQTGRAQTGQAPARPPESPTSTFAVYVVAVGSATDDLYRELPGFLDRAGRRRDPRVSVGYLGPAGLLWPIRTAVPYDIRVLPRYPDRADAARVGTGAVLRTVLEAVRSDRAEPSRPPHAILLLLWGAECSAEAGPSGAAADDVLDLVVQCHPHPLQHPDPRAVGMWSPVPSARRNYLLTRTGPAARTSLLAHCGRLFDGWSAFTAPPAGVALTELGRPA